MLNAAIRAVKRKPVHAVLAVLIVAAAVWIILRCVRKEGMTSGTPPGWKYAGWLGDCNFYSSDNGSCPSWAAKTGAYGSSWPSPYNAFHCVATTKNGSSGKTCLERLRTKTNVASAAGFNLDIVAHQDSDGGGGDMVLSEPGGNLPRGWDDAISSVSVPPGKSVTLYRHRDRGGSYLRLGNFGGSSTKRFDLTKCAFYSDKPGVCMDNKVWTDNWNDTATSYSIP